MKILIDMNLSPSWEGFLKSHGINAQHWSGIGDVRAPDNEIMEFARANGWHIFTHDLDFGILLALTHNQGPSVIQIRIHDISIANIGETILKALKRYDDSLKTGSLITIDEDKIRIRILPIS